MHSFTRTCAVPGLLLLVACSPPGHHVQPQTTSEIPPVERARRPPVPAEQESTVIAKQPTRDGETTSEDQPVQERADLSEVPAEADEVAKRADEIVAPQLTDDGGHPLPQTDEKPSLDSARFQKDMRLLFDAIVADDAAIAASFFFPKIAYEQVKNIPDPAGDWEARLFAAYGKDIHAYHQALGKYREEATFEELRVAEQLARWVKPGEEVNKEGYYRVMRSVLVYRDHEGRKRELGLRTMISWRGQWYVVHLK